MSAGVVPLDGHHQRLGADLVSASSSHYVWVVKTIKTQLQTLSCGRLGPGWPIRSLRPEPGQKRGHDLGDVREGDLGVLRFAHPECGLVQRARDQQSRRRRGDVDLTCRCKFRERLFQPAAGRLGV